jgi:hypothetical protein
MTAKFVNVDRDTPMIDISSRPAGVTAGSRQRQRCKQAKPGKEQIALHNIL